MPQFHKKNLGLVLAGFLLCAIVPLAYSQNPGNQFREENATTLSGPEQLSRANTKYTEMENALKQVEALQEAARKEKAILRLDCISEKLSEIRELFKIVRPGLELLAQAVNDNNASGRLHEYTKISIAHERTLELAAEAETCAGEEVTYAGDTIVECVTDDGSDCEDLGPDPTDPTLPDPPFDRPAGFSPLQ